MNMAYIAYQDQEFESANEGRNSKDNKSARNSRRPSYSRKSRGPASFNGMHRRRNKRYSW